MIVSCYTEIFQKDYNFDISFPWVAADNSLISFKLQGVQNIAVGQALGQL